MCLHLTDVQRGHSTSTQGKAPLVTVRYEMFYLWLFSECSVMSHFQNKHFDFDRVKKKKGSIAATIKTCVSRKIWEKRCFHLCFTLCGRWYCSSVCTYFWSLQPCFPGLISSEDRVDCRLCPAGFSCDPANGTLSICPPGQHSPEGILKCLTCPVDSVCTSGFPVKVEQQRMQLQNVLYENCLVCQCKWLGKCASVLNFLLAIFFFLPCCFIYVRCVPDSVGLASSPMWITLHVLTASQASIPLRALSSVCSVLQVEH